MGANIVTKEASQLFYWRLRVVAIWLLLLLIDQGSKMIALQNLTAINSAYYPYGGSALGQFAGVQLALVLAFNKGAAWSLFEWAPTSLFVVRLALILSLSLYLLKVKSLTRLLTHWFPRLNEDPLTLSLFSTYALVFLVAGAISNCFDQCYRGHVVDMLSVTLWGYFFPVFNIADSVISLAAVGLVLMPSRQSTLP